MVTGYRLLTLSSFGELSTYLYHSVTNYGYLTVGLWCLHLSVCLVVVLASVFLSACRVVDPTSVRLSVGLWCLHLSVCLWLSVLVFSPRLSIFAVIGEVIMLQLPSGSRFLLQRFLPRYLLQ